MISQLVLGTTKYSMYYQAPGTMDLAGRVYFSMGYFGNMSSELSSWLVSFV